MIEIYAALLFFLLTRGIMALAAKELTAEQNEKICTEKILVPKTEDEYTCENSKKGGPIKETKKEDGVKKQKKKEDGYSLEKCIGHVKTYDYDLFESIILHDWKQLEATISRIICLINSPEGFIEGRQNKKAISGVT